MQIEVLAAVLAALALSLWIADRAAGGRTGMVWWGLLGPVGWIIASVRGVQDRMDYDLVHRPDED